MIALPEHLHPMVVHFPIALFISALGLEVLSILLKKESLHQTAIQIYVVAALLTPFVVKTGLWEEQEHQIHHPVLELHEQFAFITMWTSLVSLAILWIFHHKIKKYFRIIFFVFLEMVVASVSIAAYNGGRMVYEYGIGVEE